MSFPGENATRPLPWEAVLPSRRPPQWETLLGICHSCRTLLNLLWSLEQRLLCLYGRTHLPMKKQPAVRTASLHTVGQAWQTGTHVLRHCPLTGQNFSEHRFYLFVFLLLKGGYRKWQPTPVFLPGESHGRRSLVGCGPRGRKESDTTERLHFHFHYSQWSASLMAQW